jgi:hypothetical protein
MAVVVVVVAVDVMMYHVVVITVVRVVAVTHGVTRSLVVGDVWQSESQFLPE